MSFSNPIPRGTIGRTDQGVDISASPGDPLIDPVPGKSQRVGVIANWFQGQPYYWFKVLTGKFKGKYWYTAEQVDINVPQGGTVQQGQQIGKYAASGTATEWGWATASGSTLARATTGYTEGQQTPAGADFASRVRGGKGPTNVPGGAGPTVTGWKVIASQESDGGMGSCGPIGSGGVWYSELSTVPQGTGSDFHALGGLPCMTALKITNPANGKSVIAHKRDVGAGSAFLPVMGLYPETARQLGLSGGKYTVIISRPDGGPLHPVRGTQTTVSAGSSGVGPGSGGQNRGGGSGSQSNVDSIVSDYVALRDAPRTDPTNTTFKQSFNWWFPQFRDAVNKVFGG